MIPMRQLHTPVYKRERVVDMVGVEHANALAMEFVFRVPDVLSVISESIDVEDWGQVLGCGVMLAKMAEASGASQIHVFSCDLVEELQKKDMNPDKVKLTVALIATSLEQFLRILANHVEI